MISYDNSIEEDILKKIDIFKYLLITSFIYLMKNIQLK